MHVLQLLPRVGVFIPMIHGYLFLKTFPKFLRNYSYNTNLFFPQGRRNRQRRSTKKVFHKVSQNSQENPHARVSFLIKLQTWPVFSCELCETLTNNHSEGPVQTAASARRSLNENCNELFFIKER